MKFLMFLINTPKASLPGLVVAVAQIVKYTSGGYLSCDKATLDQIADSLSVVFGFLAIYFAAKGQWPSDPGSSAPGPSAGPPAVKIGIVILLAFYLSLSACAGPGANTPAPGFQEQWNQLTADQKARIILNGLQKELEKQFDQAKMYVDLNPQYKPAWKFEIIPMFDRTNKAIKAMAETTTALQLTPEGVYVKLQPMINELAIKLISIGMQKGGIINGVTGGSYAGCGIGAPGHQQPGRDGIPDLATGQAGLRRTGHSILGKHNPG